MKETTREPRGKWSELQRARLVVSHLETGAERMKTRHYKEIQNHAQRLAEARLKLSVLEAGESK